MPRGKLNPEYYQRVFKLHSESQGVDRATKQFGSVFDRIEAGIEKLLQILDNEKKTDKGNGQRLGG